MDSGLGLRLKDAVDGDVAEQFAHPPEPTDTLCVEFWSGVARDELLIGHCAACDQYHFYPRERCPHCGASDVSLRPSCGMGSLTSYSAIWRPPVEGPWKIPYIIEIGRAHV
jgi:uncharacterized OB-fold protein